MMPLRDPVDPRLTIVHTGPKFDQKILNILLRFHSHHVALIASVPPHDICDKETEMFYVSCGLMTSKVNPDVVILRFARVVFGVSSSPILLNTTIKHHVEKFSSSHPEVVKELLHSV